MDQAGVARCCLRVPAPIRQPSPARASSNILGRSLGLRAGLRRHSGEASRPSRLTSNTSAAQAVGSTAAGPSRRCRPHLQKPHFGKDLGALFGSPAGAPYRNWRPRRQSVPSAGRRCCAGRMFSAVGTRAAKWATSLVEEGGRSERAPPPDMFTSCCSTARSQTMPVTRIDRSPRTADIEQVVVPWPWAAARGAGALAVDLLVSAWESSDGPAGGRAAKVLRMREGSIGVIEAVAQRVGCIVEAQTDQGRCAARRCQKSPGQRCFGGAASRPSGRS